MRYKFVKYKQIKHKICEAGSRLYKGKYLVGGEGNISIRYNDLIFITPTGKNKGFLKVKDIAVMDIEGNFLENRPSSEYKMHLQLYKDKPEISAIVHAHPPFATAFACQKNIDMKEILLPELTLYLRDIGIVPYSTPSTNEVSSNISKISKNYDVFLLQNHGAVVCSNNMDTALDMMEILEKYFYILYLTFPMKNTYFLSSEQINKLKNLI